ncbi:unnamed protein product, partial [Didymodactylos carnosus]
MWRGLGRDSPWQKLSGELNNEGK